jgi:arginyl-tRNA synthetase
MHARLKGAVTEALAALGAGEATFTIERPRLEHGDYATNAALSAAKLLKKSPKEVAELLKQKLEGKVDGVAKIEIAGAGFLNFWLSRDALAQHAQAAAAEKVPSHELHKAKTVVVEYTDPNPFKEFHIGHLMSNAIGESIARLLECSGAQVVRANYQGDVGPHVAKALWGKMQKPELPWGAAYAYGAQEYEAHKEEMDALNKKVYDRSDAAVNALYEQGRAESLEHFEQIYKKLGTKFDHYFFESETAPRGLALVAKHKDIFEESDGAVVYRGAHTRVFVTSQGLPTYEAKELGLAEQKQEKCPADLYLTVTAGEQSGFFEVVYEAAQKIFPALAGKLLHRAHGHMRFVSGKMSSRTGNVITGESLIEDLAADARGREDVAVGAVKYAVLKSGSGKDIIFDPAQSLSLEGDSGPYLQYARVRAASLLAEGAKANLAAGTEDMPPETGDLERVLIHFPDIVARSAAELEPHHVTTYLTELAGAFNSWYANNRVIGGKNPRYGLLLVQAVERTLAQGLWILGIPAPEEM